MSHLDLLDTVDGPCIIHHDFRPGNMIVHEGMLQGIIFWTRAHSGFAEQDFCSMEHGEWPIQPPHKEAFLDGYVSVRPVPNYRQIMPLLRLERALSAVAFCIKSNPWEEKNSKTYQQNRGFLENFSFTP